MKIKFLKAGSGDCILISYKSKNILIDGGNEKTFLLQEYERIKNKGEQIDFLIVTHNDDDHIKGILDLFNSIEIKNEQPLIKYVIFNSPRIILNTIKEANPSSFLSYKQAHQLEEYLIKYKIDWNTSINTTELEEIISAAFDDSEFIIKIHSPQKDLLDKYATAKGAYLTSDYRCDWNSPLQTLLKHIDDISQDLSTANMASIVLSMTYKKKNYLFCADVTPNRLINIVNNIRKDSEQIEFEYIKLPHHGSYRSLNQNILDKIKCNNFIISTNGKKHYLPNKKTILKIIKNRQRAETKTNFYFNYGEVITSLKFSNKDEKDLNIRLIHNNYPEGYVVSI